MFGLPITVIVALIEAAPTIIADMEALGKDAGPLFTLFAGMLSERKKDGLPHNDAVLDVALGWHAASPEEQQRLWDRAQGAS